MDAATTLQLAIASEALIAVLYVWAGVTLARRVYTPGTRRAGVMFSLFWFGIAATGLASATAVLLAQGDADARVLDALGQASLLFFAIALVGFTSYLAFIFRGDHRADAVIVPAYVLLVSWSAFDAILHPATGYRIEAWRPIVERPSTSIGPSPAVTALLLVVPTLGGAAAYASLLRTALDRETRYRIGLVSGALLAWLVGVTVVSVPAWGEAAVAQLAGRIVIVASAALILLAYRPPERVRGWLAGEPAVRDAAREAARARRLQQLI